MSFAASLPRGYKSKPDETKRRHVQRSGELARVLALPRRKTDNYDQDFADALSSSLVKPGSDFKLRGKQAAMLVEAIEAGGLFGMVGTGECKTTIAALFAHVLDVSPCVLLVPPAIKREIETRVIPWLSKHIDFEPPNVYSYSELSTIAKGDILDQIKPALIVCDEVHNLKAKTAARTKRFLRYFAEHPDTMLIALSGTIARKSLMDFWHIIQLTHKAWKTPVTRQWKEAQDWALALDPQVPEDQRLLPGSLAELCAPGEDIRNGFRRRLTESEGVVAGSIEAVGASLVINKISTAVPPSVETALKTLRDKWEAPDGELITDALDFTRKAREVAQGFYYVWDWPRQIPDLLWLEARSAWRKAVAEVTRLNRQGLDSELLVRNAAQREYVGTARDEIVRLPKSLRSSVTTAWLHWEAERKKDDPPVKTVWISDFLVQAALKWAKAHEDTGAIIYYDSRAFEEKVTELKPRHYEVCGAGNRGNDTLLTLAEGSGTPPIVFASANAHGTGKNLQRWANGLIVAPWSGAADWEQRLARLHRPGQEADEVVFDVFCHTVEFRQCIETATEQAKFLEGMTGGKQKMLQAQWQSLQK